MGKHTMWTTAAIAMVMRGYKDASRAAIAELCVGEGSDLQDFDRRYRYCYGFDTYQEVKLQRVVCRCYKDVGPVRVEIDAYIGPCDPGRLSGFDCEEDVMEFTEFVRTKGASDGVVPEWSQAGVNTVEYYSFDARGSNHFQMKNDKNARDVFLLMYETETFGDGFMLERR